MPVQRCWTVLVLVAAIAYVVGRPCAGFGAAPAIAPYPLAEVTAYDNGAFRAWETLATSATLSPVTAAPGDLVYQWTAPDHRMIRDVVRLPRPPRNAAAMTMAAVPPNADARGAFEAALARARSTKAARLDIPRARYVFGSLAANGLGHLVIENLSDITIDGHGATLVFTHNDVGILIRAAQRVRLTHFNIEYNFPTVSLGTIEQKDGQKTLVVDNAFPVGAADHVSYLSEFNPETRNWVKGGLRAIFPPGSAAAPVFLGDQTYASPGFRPLAAGKTYAVFHHFYGGAAVRVGDSPGPGQPEDIVIDDVSVHSGPGMGILAYGITRGFAVINSRITPDAGSRSGASTEYDAIHILELGGDLVIAHNVISGQGDDAINLNNPISRISAIDAATRSIVLAPYSRFISPGDLLAFFDAQGRFAGKARVHDTKPLGGLDYRIGLDDIPQALDTTYVVRDVNLIDSRFAVVENNISRCNCHGILIQAPDGLVDHNVIKDTKDNAIRLLSNIGSFKEGTGALNVAVTNNTISDTGGDNAITMPWAAITAYAPIRGNRLTAFAVNADLLISDNHISNAADSCITISSSIRVSVVNNSCENTDLLRHGTASLHVFAAQNVRLEGNKGQVGIDIDRDSTVGMTDP